MSVLRYIPTSCDLILPGLGHGIEVFIWERAYILANIYIEVNTHLSFLSSFFVCPHFYIGLEFIPTSFILCILIGSALRSSMANSQILDINNHPTIIRQIRFPEHKGILQFIYKSLLIPRIVAVENIIQSEFYN